MVVIKRFASLLSLCFTASATFNIYNATNLENKNVGDACVKALSADIACPAHLRSFMAPSYHGSLRNVSLTDEICTGTCSASLKNWFNTVVTACADEEFGDGFPQRYGGYIWAGWNETCIRDPKTKKYCNDVIAEFTTPKKGEEIPREELCSICNIRKLATMQASRYSVYNRYYQSELEKVYKTCGGSGPTEILPPPKRVETKVERLCLSNKYYTTKEGDTCDSVAKDNPGVAGVFLYMGNQELIGDCRKLPAGLQLCLPTTCPTYVLKPNDTCWSIAQAEGLNLDDVQFYNSWIKADCSNLHKATDFYGKPICIGPFGAKDAGSWGAWDMNDEHDVSSLQIQYSSANGPIPEPKAPEE